MHSRVWREYIHAVFRSWLLHLGSHRLVGGTEGQSRDPPLAPRPFSMLPYTRDGARLTISAACVCSKDSRRSHCHCKVMWNEDVGPSHFPFPTALHQSVAAFIAWSVRCRSEPLHHFNFHFPYCVLLLRHAALQLHQPLKTSPVGSSLPPRVASPNPQQTSGACIRATRRRTRLTSLTDRKARHFTRHPSPSFTRAN